MRLSYYGGMDTYLMNTESPSYQIVPIIDKMTCLKTGEAGDIDLIHPFPDTSLFKLTDPVTTTRLTTNAFPNGVDTYVWEYMEDQETSSGGDGDSKFTPPDAGGYVGTYRLYIDANTGKPLRHHMIGHNINLGGSHFDEYILDYLSYEEKTSAELMDDLFMAPPHMKCLNFTDIVSGGPTHRMKGEFRNPLHDIVSHFPEGAKQREDDFAKFEAKFKLDGYIDIAERNARQAIFHHNLRYINAANRQGRSYFLGVNHMADWTAAERTSALGRISGKNGKQLSSESDDNANQSIFGDVPDQICGQHKLTGKEIPDRIDWRKDVRGVVHPPKDQGTCGSCWTYGITGTIEGQIAIKTGKGVSLSQQNVMDCSWGYGNMACDGGLDYMGLTWLLQHNNGSLATEASYGSYLNQDGFCHFDKFLSLIDKDVVEGAKVKSCTHVTEEWNGANVDLTEATTLFNDALANIGPLSISVDAGPGSLPSNQQDFYFYSGGIYHNTKCGNSIDDLDHTVLAVGFETTENGEKYTIIRNSWSDLWGEGGYMRISQRGNVCGVMTSPLYATLDD